MSGKIANRFVRVCAVCFAVASAVGEIAFAVGGIAGFPLFAFLPDAFVFNAGLGYVAFLVDVALRAAADLRVSLNGATSGAAGEAACRFATIGTDVFITVTAIAAVAAIAAAAAAANRTRIPLASIFFCVC